MNDDDEFDDNGMPRKRRVLRSGDTLHFPMTLQDGHVAMTDMVSKPASSGVVDGFGTTIGVGHRPGYAFSADAAAQSTDLHEQRKRYLSGLWKKRKKPAPQPQGDGDDRDSGVERRTLDQLQAARDQAWADRQTRAVNAWKGQSK